MFCVISSSMPAFWPLLARYKGYPVFGGACWPWDGCAGIHPNPCFGPLAYHSYAVRAFSILLNMYVIINKILLAMCIQAANPNPVLIVDRIGHCVCPGGCAIASLALPTPGLTLQASLNEPASWFFCNR